MNVVASLLVLTSLALTARPTETDWESHYGNALKEARSENRPLIVILEDGEASVTDPFTLQLLNGVVDETVLDDYVLCRVDVSTTYGHKVAGAFRAPSVPHLVVTDRQAQQILYRHTGTLSSDDIAVTLSKIRDDRQNKLGVEAVDDEEIRATSETGVKSDRDNTTADPAKIASAAAETKDSNDGSRYFSSTSSLFRGQSNGTRSFTNRYIRSSNSSKNTSAEGLSSAVPAPDCNT